MKPGDLRRFKDGPYGLDNVGFEGSTFMVLRVGELAEGDARYCVVDILLGGEREEGWGCLWVEDSSEAINEAG
jgi:hypothetical protein